MAARVAKPPPASWRRTTSPSEKSSVVLTWAPPLLRLSATVSSSWSTAPHSSTSWIVKFKNIWKRGCTRRSSDSAAREGGASSSSGVNQGGALTSKGGGDKAEAGS